MPKVCMTDRRQALTDLVSYKLPLNSCLLCPAGKLLIEHTIMKHVVIHTVTVILDQMALKFSSCIGRRQPVATEKRSRGNNGES